jgi:hypothetical protein
MINPSVNKEKRGKAGIVDADNFIRILDLEVNRCRRYQNYFCMVLLKIERDHEKTKSAPQEFIYRKIINLLAEEIRESDVIGSPADHCIAVILPYGDPDAGEKTRKRIEETLRYYEFRKDGYKVGTELIGFPQSGTETSELMKMINRP